MGGIAPFLGIMCALAPMLVLEGKLTVLAFALSLAIVFAVGVLDDRRALRQRTKLALLFSAGLPIVALGEGSLDLVFATIDFGAAYVLLVLIGMSAASNLTNILEGFNGEACGMGVIATAFLMIDAYVMGAPGLARMLAPVCFAYLALLYFNRYPARVFPGDTGTLLIGGAIGAATILEGFPLLGVIVLMPHIIEFFLKATVQFGGVSYGPTRVDDEGILHPPPYRSLANTLTRRLRLREPQLVSLLWLIEMGAGCVSILVALLLY
jgi:UDP-N-acetylglucosamine--dolichyl-phosphate N-acetylglucosaminephosphotransferase